MIFIPNSFIKVLIWYFLHTTITLLAALFAGIKTESSCSVLKVKMLMKANKKIHQKNIHLKRKSFQSLLNLQILINLINGYHQSRKQCTYDNIEKNMYDM